MKITNIIEIPKFISIYANKGIDNIDYHLAGDGAVGVNAEEHLLLERGAFGAIEGELGLAPVADANDENLGFEHCLVSFLFQRDEQAELV